MNNDVDGHIPVEMALAQLAPERLRGVFAALGAVHGCGAVHHGRVSDPGSQVHPELVQRVPEQPVRGPTRSHAHGRHAVRRAAFGDIHEGAEDTCRVHV